MRWVWGNMECIPWVPELLWSGVTVGPEVRKSLPKKQMLGLTSELSGTWVEVSGGSRRIPGGGNNLFQGLVTSSFPHTGYAWVLHCFSCVGLFAALWTVAHPQGSSIHWILQARILEWVAMPFSKGSSQPRDPTWISYISCIDKWVLYH